VSIENRFIGWVVASLIVGVCLFGFNVLVFNEGRSLRMLVGAILTASVLMLFNLVLRHKTDGDR
jgi:hypothetical protein